MSKNQGRAGGGSPRVTMTDFNSNLKFDKEIQNNSLNFVFSAEVGIAQSGDLILQPNYLLIAAMAGLLIAATILIMGSIGFCLHKGWSTKELTQGTYRDYQLPFDIHHENQ